MSSCPAISTPTSGLVGRLDATARATRWLVVATLSNVWVLLGCKAIIACVSALDTYLTMKYVSSLYVYELNPIGRWLMDLDTGPDADTKQIAAFITAKFLGTMMVILTIQGLSYWRARWAGLIALSIAAFQLLLIGHLFFGEG